MITSSVSRRVVKFMLTFALMEWVCERRGNERSGPKIYVSRAVSGSRKENEWSAEREVAERMRSGERRSQKWALTCNGKTAHSAPLHALHRSNRVSAEKIASCIFVLIIYSHKVQTDSTTSKQSYLICRNATVSAFRLWPTTFTEAPFQLQNICRCSVPPRYGTTTARFFYSSHATFLT